jgi:hypothetical protein
MSTRDYMRDGFPSAASLRTAAAALVALLLLGLGVVVGRATAGGGGHAPATGVPQAAASPAPAGVPSWAMGATRMDHGVPVGYAHTQQGAVDAARNYALALSATPLGVDPAATRAAYAVVSTPSFARRNAAALERTLAGSADIIAAAHQGHATRDVPFVLTTRLDRYSTDEARVTVWGGDVVAVDGVVAPQELTSEETYTLRWLGDWEIDDLADADGPGIKSLTAPAQTTTLPDELGATFQGVGDVARW